MNNAPFTNFSLYTVYFIILVFVTMIIFLFIGARAFAGNLGRMHIHWLGIGGNSVGDQGSIYIATALKGMLFFIVYGEFEKMKLSNEICHHMLSWSSHQ